MFQMNAEEEGVNATSNPVIIYAEVQQGNNPVVGARVRLVLSSVFFIKFINKLVHNYTVMHHYLLVKDVNDTNYAFLSHAAYC